MESLTVLVTVQCRSCARTYTKPKVGGTVKTNPGCPRCGSLGWIPVDEGIIEGGGQPRYVGGRPRVLASLRG